MKLVKRIVLWIVGVVGALVLAFVGLHVYYRLTPAELSEEAKALLAETAHMAQLTDNGYRMHGLLAPEGMDPVVYGKCLVNAHVEHAKSGDHFFKKYETNAERDAWIKTWSEGLKQRTDVCAGGKLPRDTLSRPQQVKLGPGLPLIEWANMTGASDVPLLLSRWESVLSGGVRGSIPDPTLAIIASLQTPLELERRQLGLFASEWSAANSAASRASAWRHISTRVAPLVAFADGTLIESMIATAGITRQLLVMQAATSGGNELDQTLAREMLATLGAVDRLPLAVSNAIGAEFQGSVALTDNMLGRQDFGSGYGPAVVEWMGRFAFDRGDTLNLFAMGYRDSQRAVQSRTRGSTADSRSHSFAANMGCPSWGDYFWVCLVLERNAAGRVIATIAIPAYADYGLRAWDVVNLAAATRLTIEARRRGLQGEALAQFIASAPEGMRDVYTQKAFTYDSPSKKLKIELKMKSTILGEKSYELSL